jgi:hypothetical protein
MANQTRIVLDQDDRPKAEAILEVTGIKTFSQLFSIRTYATVTCDRQPNLSKGHSKYRMFELLNQVIGQ